MKKIGANFESLSSSPDQAGQHSSPEAKAPPQPTEGKPESLAAATFETQHAGHVPHVDARFGQASAHPLSRGLARSVASPSAKTRLGAGGLDNLRWATAFAHFWRASSQELGVPFTPLFQSMCQRAADDRDAATFSWLIETLREPLAEPLDDDAPDPCKALMMQCIARSLCALPNQQAAPLWQKLLDRLADLTDDSFDFAYSIDLLTKESPHIADDSVRQAVRLRLREQTQQLPASETTRKEELIAGLVQDEQKPHSAIVAKTFSRSAPPPPLAALDSVQAIKTRLSETDDLPPHSRTRADAARDVFIAASARHDEPLLNHVVDELCDTACRRGDAYLVLDAFNWMVQRTAPEAVDAIRNGYIARLQDAPREALSPLLRSVALILPGNPKKLVSCAQSLLPWLTLSAGQRPSDGQMDIWNTFSRRGLLAELLPLVEAALKADGAQETANPA